MNHSKPTETIPSNYELFLKASFNQPEYYPIEQKLSPNLYRPLAAWMGRLILPTLEERPTVKGVWFEVHHAAEGHETFVGQRLLLRWQDTPEVMARVWRVARNVYLSRKAQQSMQEGLIHPHRLDRWSLVTALESLAGARPHDDIIVKLSDETQVVETAEGLCLTINREPVQITGQYYALVSFVEETEPERYRIVHYNRASQQFDGASEIVYLPQTIIDSAQLYRSNSAGIVQSSLNEHGWYVYGAQSVEGIFVVQALAPRGLLRLEPQRIISEEKAAIRYVKKGCWEDTPNHKGEIQSVLLGSEGASAELWQVGDQALVVSTYGGVTGDKPEPYPYPGGFYFGHFSYGVATVIHEPLGDTFLFDIEYYQVFSSNGDGLVPGVLHWTRYIGDRQFGYMGYRPVCDLLIKLDCFTKPFDLGVAPVSALMLVADALESYLHIYRVGDGKGGVFFGVANNCTQDSNQALYSAIKNIDATIKQHPPVQAMLERYHDEQARLDKLIELGQALKKKLLPFGRERSDWRYNYQTIDSSLSERPIVNIFTGLSSWRTGNPRWGSDSVADVFLRHGAMVWLLRTNQVGNFDEAMRPKAPDFEPWW